MKQEKFNTEAIKQVNIKDKNDKIKCLIFDLDGTLVDTLQDIAVAVNYSLRYHNLPTHDIDKYKEFLGYGSKHLIKAAVGEGYDEAFYDDVYNVYIDYYTKHPCDFAKVYKGITNALQYCYNTSYYLVIITNKPTPIAKQIVDKLFPNIQFDLVIGDGSGFPRKPNPEVINAVKKMFLIHEEEIAYFGDSEVDYFFSKNCNIEKYYSFTYGFRTKEELVNIGVTHFIDKPNEIVTMLHKEGAFKENGRLTLSIISYVLLLSVLITDLTIALYSNITWVYISLFVGFFIALLLMFVYFKEYACKKSYLNYRLFLISMFYNIAAGLLLSGFLADESLTGDLNYIFNIKTHITICYTLSGVFFALCLITAIFYFYNKAKVKGRETLK